eukprot:1136688-Pelagomonas_calceolata.AAC.6
MPAAARPGDPSPQAATAPSTAWHAHSNAISRCPHTELLWLPGAAEVFAEGGAEGFPEWLAP